MSIDNDRAFTAARLRERLLTIFGEFALSNGTPLADAVASAIAADTRAARVAPSAVDALSRDTLIDTANDVLVALNEGGYHGFDLPFGTKAVGRRAGGIKIGDADHVLDAGRPGLHPAEITRRDAHGPNLERLQILIEKKTRKLACRRLGVPVASSIAISDMHHTLQFPPCPEAGNVVLQRGACETGADLFCAAMPKQLGAFADSIVRDMRELWKHKAVIAKRVEDVRRAVEAQLLGEHGPDAPLSVAAIAVELSGEAGDQPVSLYVEINSLDEALRPGKTFDYVPAPRPWDSEGFRFNDKYAGRRDGAAQLAALGATGWINDLAAGVAAAAPEGQAAVLARLNHDLETLVVIPRPSGELYATLFWSDGCIKADVSMPGQLEAYSDKIDLRAVLAATILAAMVHRPLGDVVALPFKLPTPVLDVEERDDGWLQLKGDYGRSLVNCATGVIWPEPSAASRPEADFVTARRGG